VVAIEAPREEQGSARADLARGLAGELQREHEMCIDVATRCLDVELGQLCAGGTRTRQKHMVDRLGWPASILVDAWLLSSHYLELSLLHAMGVQSPIRDRLGSSPNVGATVKPPWVP
jgi:hypothetical protein